MRHRFASTVLTLGDKPRGASPFYQRSQKGFSLIEMIGVLTVLAILATVVISTTTTRLDITAGNLETTNLVNYASALQRTVLRNRYVPGTNDIAQVIATELGMDLKDVKVNARNNSRAFVFYPNNSTFFCFYTNQNLIDAGHLVHGGQGWSQNIGGAFMLPPGAVYGAGSNAPPSKPQIMIISSLGAALPSQVLAGNIDFQALWTLNDGDSPAGITGFTSWSGKASDLKVQRLDLSPLFVHVILYNYNYPSASQGKFSIDIDRPGGITNTVPNGRYGVDTWFIKGTTLGLFKTSGVLDANQMLVRDTSFAYVLDTWRSSVNLGEGIDPVAATWGNALWATAEAFMGSPANSLNVNSTTPSLVVTNMQRFMDSYVAWANAGFPAGSISNAARLAQDLMVTNMFNLCGSATWNINGALNFNQGACTGP
jgi:prepilin-type N-terminal cleavage/methylation domain-containing protein